MEQKQLTQEELTNIKELATKLNEITAQFGQLKVEKLNLLTQVNALDQMEKELDIEYFQLKEKEYSITNELTNKYGDGVINLETGIIS